MEEKDLEGFPQVRKSECFSSLFGRIGERAVYFEGIEKESLV